ncbi:hypothetical protein BJV82DRAFT_406980 [Fennellomyces sp. T-0311]|nr:hypothetical protein BJV82DRAFT_406980 [Fennellomyces sp. T-0311]
MDGIDTELKDLNICDQLRANSSFMKIMATLFHYGNQSMNAAQLVIAVRALNLLPLRGETPKSTIQGIISTSRKAARDLRQPDPFHIDKDNSGRQAKYSISEVVLNGATVPEAQEIPDEPIILKPVEHSTAYGSSYSGQLGKRQRKTPKFYTPDALRKAKNRRRSKLQRRRNAGYGSDSDNTSDIDVDMDDEYDTFMSMGSSDDDDDQASAVPEEDTISGYSLLYAPPTTDSDYIDPINFGEYPIASYFAIAQQKGYSYPRFRSHEKVKIPKVNCEDKFRVADIVSESTKRVIGRMFILADGHGGRGCSEFFVRNTPAAVQKLCSNYDPEQFDDKAVQKNFEVDIKKMVEALDQEYLAIKRIQLGRKNEIKNNGQDKDSTDSPSAQNNGAAENNNEELDNDGCTLIINMFFGNWLININVGDSRSVLISAPDPGVQLQKTAEELNNYPLMCGLDNDYKMDVVFASQDHKPYLEHLAREILENGGEFIDSVQDRVIKVDLDKLREDGNRQAKRVALKNARIRPKSYHANNNNNNTGSPSDDATQGYAAQSAVRTTANQFMSKPRSREDRVPSLNVARSCGDLDFKMDPEKKIISCEPDVAFFRISDSAEPSESSPSRTLFTSGIHKAKRRHFLFMSTDGMFDYMYEETPERQNRAVAKVLGPMIEDGEKVGALMLDEEEKQGGETIEHNAENKEKEEATPMKVDEPVQDNKASDPVAQSEPTAEKSEQPKAAAEEAKPEENDQESKAEQVKTEDAGKDGDKMEEDRKDEAKVEEAKAEEAKKEEEQPPKPRLFRELDEEETKERKIRERTLVLAARYFANRESVHGFFSSTLQDYDDCTIVLIEI